MNKDDARNAACQRAQDQHGQEEAARNAAAIADQGEEELPDEQAGKEFQR